MSKMRKILAVLLCAVMLMPLLPQPKAKTAEAAEEVETVDENPNLFTAGGFDSQDALTAFSGSKSSNAAWSSTEDVSGNTNSGSLCLPFVRENNATTNSYIYYSLDVEPDTIYTISLSVKFQAGGMLQIVAYDTIEEKNVNRELVSRGDSASMTEWTKKAINIRTGEKQTKLKIRLGNMNLVDGVSGTAYCYVDNLQVRKHEHIEGITDDGKCEAYYYKTDGTHGVCEESVETPLIINGTIPVIYFAENTYSFMGKISHHSWNLNQAGSIATSEEDANGRADSKSLQVVKPTEKADKTVNIETTTRTLKGSGTHYRLTWKVKGETGMKVYPRFHGADDTCKTDYQLSAYAAECETGKWVSGEVLITNMVEQTYRLFFYFDTGSETTKDWTTLIDDIELTEITDEHTDSNGDGVCDFRTDWILSTSGVNAGSYQCTTAVAGFAGAQAVLSDEVQLRLYINEGADKDAALTAKVQGMETEIKTDAESKQYIEIPFAAKEMTDKVKAELYLNAVKTAEKEYSVQEYAQTILDDSTKSSSWELVKAMLNYGAWAQTYFEYKTETLANSIVPEKDRYTDSSAREKFQSYVTGETITVKNGITELKYGTTDASSCMTFSSTDSEEYGTVWSITGVQSSSYVVWLSDTVSTDLADTYIISYWIKTDKNTGSTGLKIEPTVRWWGKVTDTGAYDYFDNSTITSSTGWRKVVLRWTRPEQCDKEFRIGIFPKLDTGDSVSIAGFKLERAENTAGIGDYQPTVESNLSSFLGYTLVLKDTTSVRLYFSEKPDSATIDGDSASIAKKGERHYIEIPDVKAGDLNKVHEITVTGAGEMTISNFSVLSAAATAINGGSANEKLKDLCVALILYAEAAKVVQ